MFAMPVSVGDTPERETPRPAVRTLWVEARARGGVKMDERTRADAKELEKKAEELRRQAARLGEMVGALNETMGRNFFKNWLYAVANVAALLPVVVLGAYLGFRIAFRQALREGRRVPFGRR